LKNYFIKGDEEIKLKYKGICTYHENNFVSHPNFLIWYDYFKYSYKLIRGILTRIKNHEICGGFDLLKNKELNETTSMYCV
jgi:hypothetical protein